MICTSDLKISANRPISEQPTPTTTNSPLRLDNGKPPERELILRKMKKQSVPIAGQKYNCYDDGKIRESRRYEVTVKEVVPFDSIDSDTLNQWHNEVKQCPRLYAVHTDYFIKTWNGNDTEHFVRTFDGGWFSMGFLCCGLLDVDGKLTQSINQ